MRVHTHTYAHARSHTHTYTHAHKHIHVYRARFYRYNSTYDYTDFNIALKFTSFTPLFPFTSTFVLYHTVAFYTFNLSLAFDLLSLHRDLPFDEYQPTGECPTRNLLQPLFAVRRSLQLHPRTLPGHASHDGDGGCRAA